MGDALAYPQTDLATVRSEKGKNMRAKWFTVFTVIAVLTAIPAISLAGPATVVEQDQQAPAAAPIQACELIYSSPPRCEAISCGGACRVVVISWDGQLGCACTE